MKRIIFSITTALILISPFSSSAVEKANPLKNMNTTAIVAVYLNATALGNPEFSEQLFARDFEYYVAGLNVFKFNRKQYLKFLKQNTGLQFNCKTTSEILAENGDSCTAKTTMQFENFTRVDYITLCRKKDSWQVSKVVTTYP
ncbi:nuclear transport factor 2 family protein [Sphingobacterium pedocola]|uniref:DUF4878 domain-containing protein n=1 Tax=Sphingobacterium pedocola TaxID=2082722 RepID=A0ABR9TCK8_9SPHI|nr:nuclear transport factor 2 family protein [Sphingobacterium pedocola]MBE8723071.1 hypothetical protein [Sphingobacterium pedocola]